MKIAGVVERKAVFSREPGMEGSFAGLGNISVICPLLLASLAFSAFQDLILFVPMSCLGGHAER